MIAAVHSRSKQEGRSTAADYDRYCHEELTRRGADVAHVAPLAPTSPTMLYRHCRDGDDEVGVDRLNTVVSTVVEDTFPRASLECKNKLVEVWERVLGKCPEAARADKQPAEGEVDADLIAALENMDKDVELE